MGQEFAFACNMRCIMQQPENILVYLFEAWFHIPYLSEDDTMLSGACSRLDGHLMDGDEKFSDIWQYDSYCQSGCRNFGALAARESYMWTPVTLTKGPSE
ncbi:hypothetical protein RJ641_027739, partial [Dillenia turbinata]